MNKKFQTFKYVFIDFLVSAFVWFLFSYYRKSVIESELFGYKIEFKPDLKFYIAIILIPSFWLLLYYLSGYYNNIYRKSRLKELWNTFLITLIGTIIIFFVLSLDDWVRTYKDYYRIFGTLFSLQFFLTYIPRLINTSITNYKIKKKKIGFKTIIIGDYEESLKIYEEFINKPIGTGNFIVGYITFSENDIKYKENSLKRLGNLNDLIQIIDKYEIEEIIIASNKKDDIFTVIEKVEYKNVLIKILPSTFDFIIGKIKINTPYDSPFIVVNNEPMSIFEQNLKRIIDVVVSVLALIVSFPLFIIIAIGVKLTSKGPIIYKQERIGRYGKPFNIYKFRTMYVDAEKDGPALAQVNDKRITPFGAFLRKRRLDELPQFFNILKNDMSLVGPRPERKYYIEQIVKRAPYYMRLLKVKPGLTSWGVVQFGYAHNVDEMIERLKYDLIYFENMSIYEDFKIIIFTIFFLIKGEENSIKRKKCLF